MNYVLEKGGLDAIIHAVRSRLPIDKAVEEVKVSL